MVWDHSKYRGFYPVQAAQGGNRPCEIVKGGAVDSTKPLLGKTSNLITNMEKGVNPGVNKVTSNSFNVIADAGG